MKRVVYLALLCVGSLSAMSYMTSSNNLAFNEGNICEQACPGGQNFCCSHTTFENGLPKQTNYYYDNRPGGEQY